MKPFARCLLALVVLFAAALAVPLAASADDAPSSSEVAAAFPSVVEAAAPELDRLQLVPVQDGPANVGAVAGRPGLMVISENGQPLRNASGEALDWTPALIERSGSAGATLSAAPSAGFDGVVSVPASGSNAPMIVGDTVATGVGFRLRGRLRAPARRNANTVTYQGVLPGASEIAQVQPNGVEQWLVLADASSGFTHTYDLVLPSGITAAFVSGEGGSSSIELRDGATVVARITAPRAIDATGKEFAVELALAADRASFTVHVVDAEHATFPLAIDPHLVRVFPAGQPNVWKASFCGFQSLNENDFNRASEKPTESCPVSNVSSLLSEPTSGAGSFDIDRDATSGLRVRLKNSARPYAAGENYAFRVNSPPGAGIVGSNFRGHIFDTGNPSYRCTVSLNGAADRSLELAPFAADDSFRTSHRPPSGTTQTLLDAGTPEGTGSPRKWAEFPMNPPYVNVPTGGANMMRGFYAVKPTSDVVASGWEQFDANRNPAHLADWVEMRLTTIRAIPKTQKVNGSGCAADGLWTVVMFDGTDPTINAPALAAIENAWATKDAVKAQAPVTSGRSSKFVGSCGEDLAGVGPVERFRGLVVVLDKREHLLGEVGF